MNVTLKDIRQIFKEHMNCELTEITECGNHDLNRNMVFKVSALSSKWVIKFYYKPLKRRREIESLSYYKNDILNIRVQGVLENGIEWLIYDFVEGLLLDKCYDQLSMSDLNLLFYEIGKEMATLHKVNHFNYFGDWVSYKQSPIQNYRSFIIDDTERLIQNIENQSICEIALFDTLIKHLRNEYSNIRLLKEGRLCHRDLDGRNILINREIIRGDNSDQYEKYHLKTFLDFEKCVVFNEHFDIVGLYKRYFMKQATLIKPFKDGYESVKKIDASFNQELKFNLLRLGIDHGSWAMYVSADFYNETIIFVKDLLSKFEELETYYI